MAVLIRNKGATPISLPYPYSGVISGGGAVVVPGTSAVVGPQLGHPSHVGAVFDLRDVDDSQIAISPSSTVITSVSAAGDVTFIPVTGIPDTNVQAALARIAGSIYGAVGSITVGGITVSGVVPGSNAITLPIGTRISVPGLDNVIFSSAGGWGTGYGSGAPGGIWFADIIRQASASGGTTGLQLNSSRSDGATAVGLITNVQLPFANVTSKLHQWQNAGVEKIYVGFDGRLSVQGVASGSIAFSMPSGSHLALDGDAGTWRLYKAGAAMLLSNNSGASVSGIAQFAQVQSSTFRGSSTNTTLLSSAVVNGATAVALSLDSGTALTADGAKIGSFRNATVEKAFVTHVGNVMAPNLGAATLLNAAQYGAL
jgi:hypothetical protein